MRQYIWEAESWPDLLWTGESLLSPLGAARAAQGQVEATAGFLGQAERQALEVQAMVDAAADTSKIEGESLNRDAVRSSVVRRLGVDDPAAAGPRDPRADAIVDITIDARRNAAEPLTEQRLYDWHARLFPDDPRRLAVGRWRDDALGPMQVVSGAVGHERVQYEAPPAGRLPTETARFLEWFSTPPGPDEDGILRSARAHFWFVTIHPFEDGNGRIARAIADLALARDNPNVAEFISMSRQILREQRDYYSVLESAQRGSGDITTYMSWYANCYRRAARYTLDTFNDALRTTRFWALHKHVPLSERQHEVLNLFLSGVDGTFTAKKYSKLTGVSTDTAQRDIADLIEKGVLLKGPGAGPSTSYLVRGAEDLGRASP